MKSTRTAGRNAQAFSADLIKTTTTEKMKKGHGGNKRWGMRVLG